MSKRGFASMSEEKRRAIAGLGGKAAHVKGTAHEFTPDEARAAGLKSALARRNRHIETGTYTRNGAGQPPVFAGHSKSWQIIGTAENVASAQLPSLPALPNPSFPPTNGGGRSHSPAAPEGGRR